MAPLPRQPPLAPEKTMKACSLLAPSTPLASSAPLAPIASLLPAAVGLLILLGPAAAQAQLLRFTAIGKDSARLEIRLETPAAVGVDYGEELFAWEGRAESPEPATRHEVELTRLLPDRQYVYHLLGDDQETGEVLTFRSGRSWIDRTALIQVGAASPVGGAVQQAVADRLFAEQAHALVVLGGDAGNEEAFRSLHGRALGERLVLETGGSGDTDALRTVAISDVAIASVGENPLVLPDGSASPAASWAATSLPAVEGACWSVAATARSVVPGSVEAKAMLAWATSASVQVLLSSAPEPTLQQEGGIAWLGLPEATGENARAIGRLRSAGGMLIVELEGGAAGDKKVISLTRDCPIPKSLAAEVGFGSNDDGMEAGLSTIEGHAEDCDY